MTSGRPRRRRRRRRKARQGSTSTATHISSLGEDVVLEIFLRLSSLATLVRAALTCRAWRRAVASSPDFRRRFRALHPAPPLLGIFMGITAGDALYRPPCVPSFVPGGFRDWDLAGPVRGGDFFLTSLLERSTKSSDPYWQIFDCCGGRILVTDNSDEDKPLTVLNPLVRRSAYEFRYPGRAYQHENETKLLYPRLICLDEDPPSSFRVVLLAYSGCTLQPSVFSSDTGEWSALPEVDVPARTSFADGTSGEASETILIENQLMKMQANGFIYWIYAWCGDTGYDVNGRCLFSDLRAADGMHLISLDTTTMEFSFAELPQCLQSSAFHAGEAEDGAACIVYLDGSSCINKSIGVVKHTRGDDGVNRWVPDRVLRFGVAKHTWGNDGVDRWVSDDRRVFRVEFDGELKRLNLGEPYCHNRLSLLAVRDGYVYLSASEPETGGCSWFMSLCLATMKVEKLFERSYDDEAYAYFMPWPPCLLACNYGHFAVEGAP